jgi:hypothetical protein
MRSHEGDSVFRATRVKTCDSISTGGLYTPPTSVLPSPATLSVTVTSVADPTKNQKTKIIKAIQDVQEVLGAFQVLVVQVFAFVALVLLLLRAIQ